VSPSERFTSVSSARFGAVRRLRWAGG
jgi:hypothetical protein